MKLKDCFILYEEDDKQIMISTNPQVFSGLIRSNRTAAFIINCLVSETNKSEIVKKMLEKYEVSESVANNDVEKVLMKLEDIGALDA